MFAVVFVALLAFVLVRGMNLSSSSSWVVVLAKETKEPGAVVAGPPPVTTESFTTTESKPALTTSPTPKIWKRPPPLSGRFAAHPLHREVTRFVADWRSRPKKCQVVTYGNGGNLGNWQMMALESALVALVADCELKVTDVDLSAGGSFVSSLPTASSQMGKLTWKELLCEDLKKVGENRSGVHLPFWDVTFFAGYFLYANAHHVKTLQHTFGFQPYGLISHAFFPSSQLLVSALDRFEESKQLKSCKLMLGIHIRYGKGARDFYFPSMSVTDAGKAVAKFAQELIDEKNAGESCVYLAADTPAVRDSFASWMKPTTRVVTQGYDARPDQSQLFNAAFDQEMLARSDIMFGTEFSTFSMFAFGRG